MVFGAAILLAELSVAKAKSRADDEEPLQADSWLAVEATEDLTKSLKSAGNDEPISPQRNADALKLSDRRRELISDLLVHAIVQVESAGNSRMVGRQGERGLMQVKRDTWAEVSRGVFGHRVSFDRAFDPNLNRRVGKAYLGRIQQFLSEHRKDWRADERSLLLACYNAGPNRVKRAGFCLSKLPESTRDYVARASAMHDYYLDGCDVDISRLLLVQTSPRARDS
jgi:hypothetical protein